METIELSIDESLLAEADQISSWKLWKEPCGQREIIAMERKHAQGYTRQPQTSDELGEWESEQEWGEP